MAPSGVTGIRENGFINKDGEVILTRVNSPPTIDEKLGVPEVYWSNDVVDYAHQTGHSRMPWHFGIHDGEATKSSQEPLSLPLEVLVDYKRPCHVHFALPRCSSQNSFGQ